MTFEDLKQSGFNVGSVSYHLGKVYFKQEMYANAKLEFLEAKKAGIPRDLFSEFLAVSAGAVKDTNIAKEEFEYLLTVNPGSFVYNFDYARILDIEGERERAKEYYVKALTSKEIKKFPSLSTWIPRRLYEIDKAKSKIIIPRIGI
jgi:tetratricopeptide (TPR) repeat protein